MTVAPGWPQDGNDPTPASQDSVSAEAESKKVLAPTLFQLPSLRSELARRPQVASNRETNETGFVGESFSRKSEESTETTNSTAEQPQVSEPIHTIDPDAQPKVQNTRSIESIAPSAGPSLAEAELPPTIETPGFAAATPDQVDKAVERIELAVHRDESPSMFDERVLEKETSANPFSIPAPPAPSEPAITATEDLDRTNDRSLRTKPTDDPITRRIPPARSLSDAPAGRSWSESIGSHGIVLGLLLVVVAAALITGRDGQENDTESNLADHSDLIEFEQGDLVAFPDESESVTSESMSMPQYEQMVAGSPTQSTAPSSMTEDLVNVTLDAPDYEAMADTTPQNSFDEAGFPVPSETVEAQTASSRKPDLGNSLEDMLEPLPQGSRPRLSTTPNPLRNLLDYVPPRPETAPTPSAGTGR